MEKRKNKMVYGKWIFHIGNCKFARESSPFLNQIMLCAEPGFQSTTKTSQQLGWPKSLSFHPTGQHFSLSLYMACLVESSTVETSDGIKLHTRVFKPREVIKDNLVVVLVHPYSVLGGCQALLKGIALGLAEKGYRAVTFDMRGAGRSTGRPSLTGFSEIKDVVAVCKWVCDNLSSDRILLVGSSAGMKNSVFFSLFMWNFGIIWFSWWVVVRLLVGLLLMDDSADLWNGCSVFRSYGTLGCGVD